MILKKLKRTNLQKTKAAMIGGLVDYILAAKDEEGYQKLQFAYAKNVITTKPEAWKQEMIALAEESIHSKMPVTHWVMSWQENEVPTREQLKEAVNIFLERMGLKEHQAIVAIHVNTANFHLHIVVNRVHPLTEKVVQPHKGFDIEVAHRIVAEIEHKQGWASNENARYRVNEQGQIIRIQRPKVVKPKAKAADFENATGEKSAQRIAQEKGHAVIKNASCWAELHAGLGKVGLRFVRKGAGAVIFVGDAAVKASSVDRNFGLSRLCKRLGEYEEGEYPAEMPVPQPEPVSHVCEQDWHEYQAQRRQQAEEHRLEQELRREAEHLQKEEQRQERQTILTRVAPYGLPMLNIARHFLMLQQQSQKAENKKKQGKARHSLPRFKHWLARKSPWLAQLWRLRGRITPDMQVREFCFNQLCRLERPLYGFQAVVQEKFADVRMDQSRLDSATALYLRCAGYSMDAVEQEILRHTPPPITAREQRDSLERRSRILQYAYGTAGDIDIAASQPTPEKVQRFIAKAEQKEQELQSAIEQQKRLCTGDPAAAYDAHSANLRQHFPKSDQASLDTMIALRMRANGHSWEAVVGAIHSHSPIVQKSSSDKDRQQYAERMAECAFGLQGTHDMMRNKSYWPLWRKVEGVTQIEQQHTVAREPEKQEYHQRPVFRLR